MKKIISGKRYDTSTACKIASYRYMDPRYMEGYEETLYKKITGEFFMYGKGGAKSPYCIEIEGNTSARASGEKIIPLSLKKAMEWAEKNLSAEEYESIFGEVSEDGETEDKIQISFWVSKKIKDKADALDETHAEIYTAGVISIENF